MENAPRIDRRDRSGGQPVPVAIDWLVLCESAFLDETERLCLVGIADNFPVPRLPLALSEHVLVARLRRSLPRRPFDIGFGIRTPSGCFIAPHGSGSAELRMIGDYVLMTLRSLPFREAGTYRFEFSVNDDVHAALDIPVWIAPEREVPAGIH